MNHPNVINAPFFNISKNHQAPLLMLGGIKWGTSGDSLLHTNDATCLKETSGALHIVCELVMFASEKRKFSEDAHFPQNGAWQSRHGGTVYKEAGRFRGTALDTKGPSPFFGKRVEHSGSFVRFFFGGHPFSQKSRTPVAPQTVAVKAVGFVREEGCTEKDKKRYPTFFLLFGAIGGRAYS
jgi:hypothetical protein